MLYCYFVERGRATMTRINSDGTDDEKLARIGQFKTDEQARDACLAHFRKAETTARNFNRPPPVLIWR